MYPHRDPHAADAVEALLGLHNTTDTPPPPVDDNLDDGLDDNVDIHPTGRRPRSGPLREVQHKYVVPAHLQPFDELWNTRPRSGLVSKASEEDGIAHAEGPASDVPETTTMMQHGSAGPATTTAAAGSPPEYGDAKEETGSSPVVDVSLDDDGVGEHVPAGEEATAQQVGRMHGQPMVVPPPMAKQSYTLGDEGAPPSKRVRVEHVSTAFAPSDTCGSSEQV